MEDLSGNRCIDNAMSLQNLISGGLEEAEGPVTRRSKIALQKRLPSKCGFLTD